MVSFTLTMAWQAVQASPTWASGVSRICRIGVSIIPLSRMATSWQPPHHLEGRVPIVSCMYSMDLRYHWLLKEEKRWADSDHCFTMSAWQSAQRLELMKKVEGMRPPVLLSRPAGWKGPSFPYMPSWSWLRGARRGFSTLYGSGALAFTLARTAGIISDSTMAGAA